MQIAVNDKGDALFLTLVFRWWRACSSNSRSIWGLGSLVGVTIESALSSTFCEQEKPRVGYVALPFMVTIFRAIPSSCL